VRFGWAGTLLASFALLNAGLAPPPAPADGASSDAVRELATLLRGVLPGLVTASNAGVCLLFARVEVDAALRALGWTSGEDGATQSRQRAALGLSAAAVAGSYLGPAAAVWPLRNAVNMCVATTAARALQLPRLPWVSALLAGLVAYDVLGVFGSGALIPSAGAAPPPGAPPPPPPPASVMEGVARAKLGAAGGWQPGLLAVFLQGRPTDALGLGDAVFPAVLSGWALRRDRYRAAQGARSTLFQAALAGYCGGCFLCEVFNSGAGQPALLFLSPATLVPVLGAAAASGDLGPAWTWPGDSADRANGAAQNGEETREDSGGGGGPG